MSPACALLPEDIDHVLGCTGELWSEIRGETLFLTGGTGFFGQWLLETFCAANDRFGLDARIVVLTRSPERFRRKAPHLTERLDVDLCVGDVRTFDFPSARAAYIIHAAAESSTDLNERSPAEMFDVLVDGTKRVLQYARHAGSSKLLLTSSGAVYGRQATDLLRVSEEYTGAPDPLAIRSAYAEGKRAAEHACAVFGHETSTAVKIARCFAFVGPHLPLDAHFAIGNFVRDALAGRPIVVRGNGTPLRSYLYSADLAVWLWTLLFRGPAGRAYNVGSPEPISIGEVATLVSNTIGDGSAPRIDQCVGSSVKPDRYVPATDRAFHDLRLSPLISLPDALRRTRQWLVGSPCQVSV